MKIIVQNNQIIGTATDDYTGPEDWIQAPEGFDAARMHRYRIVDGAIEFNGREEAKATRQSAVDAIKVTTQSGKIFDGDETSQTRMARAIVAMQAAGAPTLTWVLADNTPAQVSVAELTEALILAGQAQAAVWVIPA